MSDDISDFEARLAALELLVAFQFASQHLQSPDPAAALHRLELLLPGASASAGAEGPPAGHVPEEAVTSAAERIVQLVAALQESLPRRLVD